MRYRTRLFMPLLLTVIPQLAWANPDSWPRCVSRPLPRGSGQEAGIDPSVTRDLDALLTSAVSSRQTQSVVAVAVRRGKVFYRGSAGGARPDRIFDLASVSKSVATAPAVMQLWERRKVTLDSTLTRWLRWLDTDDKRRITLRQLLLHTSGLHSVVKAKGTNATKPEILAKIQRSRMWFEPGTKFRYSDLGFIMLGELVAGLSKTSLERYTRKHLFEPLGMCDTGYAPPGRLLSRVISPWPGGGQRGLVYDPMAARMDGVAGHTGLYSTADDLARFGQMLLNRGQLDGRRVLKPNTVRAMTRAYLLPGNSRRKRGLGWSTPSRGRNSSSRRFSHRAFGHHGFTGTSLWIDPAQQLVLVLLTNRTFIEPTPSAHGLRRRFHELVLTALEHRPGRPVKTGLDRLAEQGFRPLKGSRIGLITNRSAVDRKGRWIVDLMAAAPGVKLEAIFVPEHGLRAKLDRHIRDTTLERGGHQIPVYSLFGRRRRPTGRTLAKVDTLVFDVAAVGVRYYTYLATMGWAMEVAARRGLRFIVLDRPNPVGGLEVQGPVATDPRQTSTNYHPLPVRYGMTIGELAKMYNAERRTGARLTVVKLSGWRRGRLFNQLGLPWVNPSPNIRSWRQALLYAGVGLLEGTNLAVGRGTDSPFQLLGAPWIASKGEALAREVNRQRVSGVLAVPASFTPTSSRHKGRRCHGVRLLLTDARRLDPVALGVALALGLQKLHPRDWDTSRLHKLVRHPPTLQAILQGKKLRQIRALWRPGLRRFRQARRRYLLYR